ncbi:hypothetical protein MHN80_23370 [Gordonia McavH-238-E]|uniref:hypothetical protein n=1 Tax=Gordonia sp. McavH-238-E TaxID=2917736 RepID=UPI001EF685CA|nr:hypothetical protein [Gordonia sp. McavH-238-E]MCG7635262.1 hypothetical protein [Gordonia sp. McavH-238-E]
MKITIRENEVALSEVYDFSDVRLLTGLDAVQLARTLRRHGVGYVDGPAVHVNTLWLRNQQEGPQWQAGIDGLIFAAETLGHFDGVFITTPITSLPLAGTSFVG